MTDHSRPSHWTACNTRRMRAERRVTWTQVFLASAAFWLCATLLAIWWLA